MYVHNEISREGGFLEYSLKIHILPLETHITRFTDDEFFCYAIDFDFRHSNDFIPQTNDKNEYKNIRFEYRVKYLVQILIK